MRKALLSTHLSGFRLRLLPGPPRFRFPPPLFLVLNAKQHDTPPRLPPTTTIAITTTTLHTPPDHTPHTVTHALTETAIQIRGAPRNICFRERFTQTAPKKKQKRMTDSRSPLF